MKFDRAFKMNLFFVLLAMLLSILLYYSLTGFERLADGTLSYNMHDTYFIIRPFHALNVLFVTLLFVFFLLRQVFLRFRDTAANIILLAANVLLVFFITASLEFMVIFIHYYATYFPPEPAAEGWTIYPPLSALPKAMPATLSPDEMETRAWGLTLLKTTLTALAAIIGVLTGLNLYRNKKP
jgi:heme/copper-type cytochrome/quinol oxidase subunit 1